MGTYKYKAFISYSHKDDRWGRWLHRRLETYPLPRNIVGNVTGTGPIPRRLKPIFRDREELAAADNLGDKIEQALSNSENLIMICSPAAARSHWVNQEILYFKRHNRGAQIFSVIVEGEPFASNMPGREDEECFPPALRYQLDEQGELSDIPAEPLAADLRDHADGKRLGVLKLVSGMIGVGLDEVVQRDMRRGRKRATAITTGALATVLAMGTLTGFALDARQEAEQRRVEAESAKLEAEARRQDAEGLVDFMIKDLRSKLEPVGRIDVMDGVAKKVLEYYDTIGLESLGCTEKLRRAKALILGAEVAYKGDDNISFSNHSSEAFNLTESILRSCDDPVAVFEHAQSTFWSGYYSARNGDMDLAKTQFSRYKSLAKILLKKAPDNATYKNEVASTYINIGYVHLEQNELDIALENFQHAIRYYKELLKILDQEIEYSIGYANAVGYVARANYFKGDISKAKQFRQKEIEISTSLYRQAGQEAWRAAEILAASHRNLGRLEYLEGNYSEAIKHADMAEKYFTDLTEHEPENSKWLRGLGKSQALLIAVYYKYQADNKSSAVRNRLKHTLTFLPKETEGKLLDSLDID